MAADSGVLEEASLRNQACRTSTWQLLFYFVTAMRRDNFLRAVALCVKFTISLSGIRHWHVWLPTAWLPRRHEGLIPAACYAERPSDCQPVKRGLCWRRGGLGGRICYYSGRQQGHMTVSTALHFRASRSISVQNNPMYHDGHVTARASTAAGRSGHSGVATAYGLWL